MNWVNEVLRRYNLGEKFRAQQPLLLWPEIVGSQIARITKPIQFTDGILTVAVNSAAARQELFLLRAQYIARLNQAVGDDVVREIRFIPGRIPLLRRVPRPPLDPHLPAEASHMFADVPDPQLQRSFTQLYVTLRQREAALLAAGAKRCVRCGVVFFGDGDLCPGCRFDHSQSGKPG